MGSPENNGEFVGFEAEGLKFIYYIEYLSYENYGLKHNLSVICFL